MSPKSFFSSSFVLPKKLLRKVVKSSSTAKGAGIDRLPLVCHCPIFSGYLRDIWNGRKSFARKTARWTVLKRRYVSSSVSFIEYFLIVQVILQKFRKRIVSDRFGFFFLVMLV